MAKATAKALFEEYEPVKPSERPTLKNLQKKPAAVIQLTVVTASVDGWIKKPESIMFANDGSTDAEIMFDWFNSADAASDFFDDMVGFNKEDIGEHGQAATFLTAEVTDTKSMKFGRFDVQPDTEANKRLLAAVKKDPVSWLVIERVYTEDKAVTDAAKKTVKPRQKSSTGGKAVVDLAAKKSPAKKAPAAKAPAKTAAKKVTPPKKSTTSKAPAKAEGGQSDQTAALRKRLASKSAPAKAESAS